MTSRGEKLFFHLQIGFAVLNYTLALISLV